MKDAAYASGSQPFLSDWPLSAMSDELKSPFRNAVTVYPLMSAISAIYNLHL